MGDKIVKSKNLCCQPVVFPSPSLLMYMHIIYETLSQMFHFKHVNHVWIFHILCVKVMRIGKIILSKLNMYSNYLEVKARTLITTQSNVDGAASLGKLGFGPRVLEVHISNTVLKVKL